MRHDTPSLSVNEKENEKMKSNQKAIEGKKDAGVSAVIGVILMVALTVAIASTTYYFVSGMSAQSQNVAPNIAFIKGEQSITVTSVGSSAYAWNTFEIAYENGSYSGTITPPSGNVKAGDVISQDNATSIQITYQGTNLLGKWTFP